LRKGSCNGKASLELDWQGVVEARHGCQSGIGWGLEEKRKKGGWGSRYYILGGDRPCEELGPMKAAGRLPGEVNVSSE